MLAGRVDLPDKVVRTVDCELVCHTSELEIAVGAQPIE